MNWILKQRHKLGKAYERAEERCSCSKRHREEEKPKPFLCRVHEPGCPTPDVFRRLADKRKVRRAK